ncbi:serpin family protein [Prosthecobacter sp.]|uniref:serpin family protein n=1 Tax=Prosthecobacter sp. TaxID=1965333 RepID=UPI0037830238
MNRHRLLLLLLPACSCFSHAAQPQLAAQAANAHAFELFQLFRPMTEGNFCFSPFSSHQLASLLMTAAEGETRQELAKLAHLQGGTEKELEDLGAMRSALAATVRRGSLTLEMTHSLWATGAGTFDPAFLSSAQTLFGASLQKLPAADATASAVAVNRWVREKTRGRIPQIVGPASFSDPARSLVALNTLFLKGLWQSPFELKNTKPRPFQTPEKGSVMLPMMMKTAEPFYYSEAESWQCLQIPMTDHEVHMLVLLPRDEAARKKIEAGLTLETWNATHTQLADCDVNLMLPRFSYSTQLSLKGLWQTLGAKSLFQNGAANLSKGLPGGGYFISDVAHEAMIEVNELGAEAAAVTAAPAEPFGAPPAAPKRRVVTFNANHPFIWALQHDTTGLILFIGRYAGS